MSIKITKLIVNKCAHTYIYMFYIYSFAVYVIYTYVNMYKQWLEKDLEVYTLLMVSIPRKWDWRT